MNRKRKLLSYFKKNVEIDMQAIARIKQYPDKQVAFMGGVHSWYMSCCAAKYDELKKGIEYAGYKYPDSDSVWERAIGACKLVTSQKLFESGY